MEYPKFTWDKDMFPDIPPETSKDFKDFKEYMKRHPFIPCPDPYVPSMSFEKWKDIMNKRCGVIDEPTHIKPIVIINPTRESSWVKEFEKWLNDKNDETEI